MDLNNIFIQKKLISHNKKIFKNLNYNKKKKFNFLVEFNAFHYNHIIFSHMVNYFKKKFNSEFFAYPSHSLLSYPIENSFFKSVKIFLLKLLNIGTYGVYKSFGINNFINPNINNEILKKTKKVINKLKIKSQKEILNLKINSIPIGDLVYDTYLKKYREEIPTVDVNSKKFTNFLQEFISLYFFWEKIIINKKIDRIIISHSQYSIGLPARICVHYGGQAYHVEFDRLTKLNKKNFFQFSSSKYYKKNFLKFSKKQKKIFTNMAANKLLQRTEGSVKDIQYMTKSAYNNKKISSLKNILNKNNKNKYKILIATHDFVDAPHVNGKFVFSDMIEWINFLLKFSKETNYVWYIKNHPSMNDKYKPYQKYTRRVVDRLIKNSNFILIDSNISHNLIIKKLRIDCALTVWGQIAHEYAFKKIPVINASNANIHSSFKFNFHADNLKDYKFYLKNFYKLKNKLNFNEVLGFYYMHYIHSDKNWFFKDIEKFLEQVGGYHNLSTNNVYKIWIENFNKKDIEAIYKRLDKFINSKNLVLSKSYNNKNV